MAFLYKANPAIAPYKLDQIGLVVSIAGGLCAASDIMAVDSYNKAASIGVAICCAANPIIFALNKYVGKYEKGHGDIQLTDSATFIALTSLLAVLSINAAAPINNMNISVFCSSYSAYTTAASIACRFLQGRQYKNNQGQDYGLCANSGIILGYGLGDGALAASMFAAAHKLQAYASPALESYSDDVRRGVTMILGISLFALIKSKLSMKIPCIEEKQI